MAPFGSNIRQVLAGVNLMRQGLRLVAAQVKCVPILPIKAIIDRIVAHSRGIMKWRQQEYLERALFTRLGMDEFGTRYKITINDSTNSPNKKRLSAYWLCQKKRNHLKKFGS